MTVKFVLSSTALKTSSPYMYKSKARTSYPVFNNLGVKTLPTYPPAPVKRMVLITSTSLILHKKRISKQKVKRGHVMLLSVDMV